VRRPDVRFTPESGHGSAPNLRTHVEAPDLSADARSFRPKRGKSGDFVHVAFRVKIRFASNWVQILGAA